MSQESGELQMFYSPYKIMAGAPTYVLRARPFSPKSSHPSWY